MDDDEKKIRQAAQDLGAAIAEVRGPRGRDFVRRLPAGELLDWIDGDRKGHPLDRMGDWVAEVLQWRDNALADLQEWKAKAEKLRVLAEGWRSATAEVETERDKVILDAGKVLKADRETIAALKARAEEAEARLAEVDAAHERYVSESQEALRQALDRGNVIEAKALMLESDVHAAEAERDRYKVLSEETLAQNERLMGQGERSDDRAEKMVGLLRKASHHVHRQQLAGKHAQDKADAVVLMAELREAGFDGSPGGTEADDAD